CERLRRQFDEVEREAADIAGRIAALADPAEKKLLVDEAEVAVQAAEAAAMVAETTVGEKRVAETAARAPLSEARTELQRIETEAHTLARVLNAGTGDLFPAVVEQIRVE